MMRRIRLIISYDGTAYVGWQTQPNGVSIQETIEHALSRVTKEHIVLHGSGRTDSGVHAFAQVAHFDTEARMPADKIAIATNMFLPPDIRILFSEECSMDFHSRFSSKRKEYRYRIHIGTHSDVFSRNTALQLHHIPDFCILNDAARELIGEHDFHAFMSSGTSIDYTVRTIYKSEWIKEGPYLVYCVCGNGFLYNMVRIMVGTMLEIAFGNLPFTAISSAFSSGERSDLGPTAPAKGLALYRVIYDDFDTSEVLSHG